MNRLMQRPLLIAAVFVSQVANAASPVAPVNADSGVAVHGYDVVAYFTDSKPVRGSTGYQHEWMGTIWRFASEQNLKAFAESPEKYAPQFGGYCAWAVGHNYTANGDPEAWRIVDGKLYLNYSRSVQKQWEQDRDKWIADGSRNWPALHK